jgi:hypothetical protein
MTTLKSLPARPSQQSLRKQAKKLVHDIAAGNAAGISRARAQLPDTELPLSQRDAQLVLAREYGYAGWQDLSAEVAKRLGQGLEWAADQAERAIHDNDIERLKQLLSEYPALLSWGLEYGGLVGRAVASYGDSSDPDRERVFTRRECAEFLIDAGATVVPWLADSILSSRAGGLIRLFFDKGLLPRTLKFLVALSDEEGALACFDQRGVLRPAAGGSSNARDIVNEAFLTACAFKQESTAAFLLERAIALSPELGSRIDNWRSRSAFVEYMCKNEVRPTGSDPAGFVPWQAFLRHRLMRTIDEGDVSELKRLLRAESGLIGESNLRFEVELIEHAVLKNQPEIIECLFDIDPGLLERRPPPESCALGWAFTYVKVHLVPLLTRVWPRPPCRHPASLEPAHRPESARHRARLGRTEPAVRDRRFPAPARRRHQYTLELARAGKPPARDGLPGVWRELRSDAVPHRPRYRHDHRGLSMGRHRAGLGLPRSERRKDG